MTYHSFEENMLSASPKDRNAESPPCLVPTLTACDMYGGLLPGMAYSDIITNGRCKNVPVDKKFPPPDRPSGNSDTSYNKSLLISGTCDYSTAGEQKCWVVPAGLLTVRRKGAARVMSIYTNWLRSSSIKITTSQEGQNGTCLAKCSISNGQFVHAIDPNFNRKIIPVYRKADYTQEVRLPIEGVVGYERIYQQLQLNNIPDSISSNHVSDEGFQVVAYDVSGISANADVIWIFNAIIVKTEIYGYKAKGSIEIGISAPRDFAAVCWDPPST